MDSKSLRIYGFESWINLFELKINKKILSEKNPENKPVVYVLKLDEKFGRLFGKSDILYIGYTKNLEDKIYNEYILGEKINEKTKTAKRIHTYLIRSGYLGKVEVSWIEIEDYESLKKKLLEKYGKDHHELPPWNRQE
ncbi:hypothetical protein KKP97_07095 [Methanothermococcus sp. SCGC AD-155-C09]|nr:hypothetical protein [Methanothermococcus sp. SCGC AD-155-C09]